MKRDYDDALFAAHERAEALADDASAAVQDAMDRAEDNCMRDALALQSLIEERIWREQGPHLPATAAKHLQAADYCADGRPASELFVVALCGRHDAARLRAMDALRDLCRADMADRIEEEARHDLKSSGRDRNGALIDDGEGWL